MCNGEDKSTKLNIGVSVILGEFVIGALAYMGVTQLETCSQEERRSIVTVNGTSAGDVVCEVCSSYGLLFTMIGTLMFLIGSYTGWCGPMRGCNIPHIFLGIMSMVVVIAGISITTIQRAYPSFNTYVDEWMEYRHNDTYPEMNCTGAYENIIYNGSIHEDSCVQTNIWDNDHNISICCAYYDENCVMNDVMYHFNVVYGVGVTVCTVCVVLNYIISNYRCLSFREKSGQMMNV